MSQARNDFRREIPGAPAAPTCRLCASVPAKWLRADPSCPTIVDAAAFRAARIPPRVGGRGDGRRAAACWASDGAKRVMPPNLATRKYPPAQPRHGRAGCASPSR
jgi:hypothetical protein